MKPEFNPVTVLAVHSFPDVNILITTLFSLLAQSSYYLTLTA